MSESEHFTEDLNNLPEDVRKIERLLASLKPRAAGINRDRVMFLAGQASTLASQRKSRSQRIGRWMWPSATVCSACIGLLVGIWIAAERGAIKAPAHPTELQASHTGTAPPVNEGAKLAALQPKALPEERVAGDDAEADSSGTWLAQRESRMALEEPPARGDGGGWSESSMGYRELTRRWLSGSERQEL
jgi:hypothetical protein